MIVVRPGESLNLGNASKIRVTNLSSTKNGSFSVEGMSKVLKPLQGVDVNLMVENDKLINSGKTDLEVNVLQFG